MLGCACARGGPQLPGFARTGGTRRDFEARLLERFAEVMRGGGARERSPSIPAFKSRDFTALLSAKRLMRRRRAVPLDHAPTEILLRRQRVVSCAA